MRLNEGTELQEIQPKGEPANKFIPSMIEGLYLKNKLKDEKAEDRFVLFRRSANGS